MEDVTTPSDEFDEFASEQGVTVGDSGDAARTEEGAVMEDEPSAEDAADVGDDGPASETSDDTSADESMEETDPDADTPAEAPADVEDPMLAVDADSAASATVPIARRGEGGGVGIHRLATIEDDQALANAAIRAITEADAAGIIAGPDGSVWIPLSVEASPELLDGVITERVPGDDTRHVLVLTREGDALDLTARVQSTEVSGSETAGGWTLRFRIGADESEAVRIATRRFLGRSVAWIGDGRILAIDRPMIPISGQANVPSRFPSETDADAVARLLEGRGQAGTETSSEAEPAPTDGAPVGNIVVGAGSLPPDQYVEYVVKAGDTFTRIAEAWFGDADKHSLIAAANPFKESSQLAIGDVLRLPPKDAELQVEIPRSATAGGSTIYVVRSGDTLGKIAQAAYGKASLWPRIHEANKDVIGDDPGNLKVGMKLEIPE